MDDRANSDQFWFAQADSGRVHHIIVVHFERWKDGVEGRFRYPTFRMQRLGAHDYLHQTFPFDDGCDLVTPQVRAMFDARQWRLPPQCVATRFVRAASADERSEIILFYVEMSDVLPSTEGRMPGGLPAGYDLPAPPDTPFLRLDRRLTEEFLRVISVRDR